MLAVANESEMARTLIILAGANARSAAHRFATESLEAGKLALALSWKRVGEQIDALSPPAAEAGASSAPDEAPAAADEHRNGTASYEFVPAEKLDSGGIAIDPDVIRYPELEPTRPPPRPVAAKRTRGPYRAGGPAQPARRRPLQHSEVKPSKRVPALAPGVGPRAK
jgi:hypothetical protein